MAILFLVGSLVLTTLNLVRLGRDRRSWQISWAEAGLKTALIHGVLIAISTEGLSLIHGLTSSGVTGLWQIAFWASLIWAGFLEIQTSACLPVPLDADTARQSSLNLSQSFLPNEALLWVGVAIVWLICLAGAVLIPSFTYDTMTYHLPRVMHWLQNQTVAHYPTHNLRQISLSPGSGYLIAHLVLLTGNDYLVNSPQTLALAVCVLGTGLIGYRLAGQAGAGLAAIVCISLPMGLMQAITCQNDLIVSAWLVCATYFVLVADQPSRLNLGWIITAMGMAILTKPTALLFIMPLLGVLGIQSAITQKNKAFWPRWWRGFGISTIVLALSLSLSLPSMGRNLQTFGSLLGPSFNTRIESPSFAIVLSNLLRNLALSLPFPSLWQQIHHFHQQVLNLDVNDPNTTFNEGNAFSLADLWWRILLPEDENFVGYPVQLILFGISICGLLILSLRHRQSESCIQPRPDLSGITTLMLSHGVGFLLFCTLLKWQVWGNRLLLPWYVLNAPITAAVLAGLLWPRVRRLLQGLLIGLALVYCLNPVISFFAETPGFSSQSFFQQLQMIWGPERPLLHFRGAGPPLQAPYLSLVEQAIADHCDTIGLDLGSNDWEYPLWKMLGQKFPELRLKHINVTNPSSWLPTEFPDRELCAQFKIRGALVKYQRQ